MRSIVTGIDGTLSRGASQCRRTIRRITGLLMATVAVLALSGSPVSAHSNATSDGCTGIDSGYTCFGVNYLKGTTHVASFYQSRGKDQPQICNYQARFTVSRNNSTYWAASTSFHQGCFYFFRATRSLRVEKTFRNPSKACGSWYESRSRLGTACLILHS